MKITINTPNLRNMWKEWRGVKLSLNEARHITCILQNFRNSNAGEYYVFGIDAIIRMEDVIDYQLFDGRVWRKGELVRL